MLSIPLTFFDTFSLEVNNAQQTQNPIRTDNLNADKEAHLVDRPEQETQTTSTSDGPNYAPSDTSSDKSSEPVILKVQTAHAQVPTWTQTPNLPRVFVESPKAFLEPGGTSLHTRNLGYLETRPPPPSLLLETCLRIPTQIRPHTLHGTCNAGSPASQPLVGLILSCPASPL